MFELRAEGHRGWLCKPAGEMCVNDLSIAVYAGASFIKAVGEGFAVRYHSGFRLELMSKHVSISVSSAVVSLVLDSAVRCNDGSFWDLGCECSILCSEKRPSRLIRGR